jgi:hypothetical protein
MVAISVEKWWKAKEIPLGEVNWRNIRLYWQETEHSDDWSDCIYFIRLSPRLLIKYEKDDSPEIYVGSGNIQQRWQSHRKRLSSLGAALPGGRYEVWVFRDERYRMIEADTLLRFKEYYGSLPLLNQRLESPTDTKARFEYSKSFDEAANFDRRYLWALRPINGEALTLYEKGAPEE